MPRGQRARIGRISLNSGTIVGQYVQSITIGGVTLDGWEDHIQLRRLGEIILVEIAAGLCELYRLG